MKDTKFEKILSPFAFIVSTIFWMLIVPICLILDKIYKQKNKNKLKCNPFWNCAEHKKDFADRYYFVRNLYLDN